MPKDSRKDLKLEIFAFLIEKSNFLNFANFLHLTKKNFVVGLPEECLVLVLLLGLAKENLKYIKLERNRRQRLTSSCSTSWKEFEYKKV